MNLAYKLLLRPGVRPVFLSSVLDVIILLIMQNTPFDLISLADECFILFVSKMYIYYILLVHICITTGGLLCQ